MSTTKGDSSIEETQDVQKTSEKPTVKKLQSHSKQRQQHGMVLYCPLSSQPQNNKYFLIPEDTFLIMVAQERPFCAEKQCLLAVIFIICITRLLMLAKRIEPIIF